MTDPPIAPCPNYSPPFDLFLSVSASIFFGRPRRSIARDSTALLDRYTPRPILNGVEHLPRNGAFVIVANHYQRPGMWIGWVGAMVTEAVNSIRPARTPVRIVVTDTQRMKVRGRERIIPLSGWFLGRVARFWEMIPLSGELTNTQGHAATLRATLGVLKQGSPVLFFPEGERGNADGLIEALPGTGTFIRLASRRATIVPCAFWEEGEQLRGKFAAPIQLGSAVHNATKATHGTDDTEIRAQIMIAIGRMLPEAMWGTYTESIRGLRNSDPGS